VPDHEAAPGGRADSGDDVPSAARGAAAVLGALETAGRAMVPQPVSLEEDDLVALEHARAVAIGTLANQDQLGRLREVRHAIADWLMRMYQRSGFSATYFGPALAPPDQRVASLEILEDLALAYMTRQSIDADVFDRLVGRWEIGTGGTVPRE